MAHTLDEVIATLSRLRDEMGGDTPVYVTWSEDEGGGHWKHRKFPIRALTRTRHTTKGVAIIREVRRDRQGERDFEEGGSKLVRIRK